MTDIAEPTGECFGDSITILNASAAAGTDKHLRLVHALIRQGEEVHSHAWVEDVRHRRVLTTGIVDGVRRVLEVPAREFERFVGAHDMTRYTLAEAYEAQQRCGHRAPWEDRYWRLCSDYVAGTKPATTGDR